MTNEQRNEQVAARLRKAKAMGFKVKPIAEMSEITEYRINSIAASSEDRNPYKYASTLTDDECERVNKALDSIKAAL